MINLTSSLKLNVHDASAVFLLLFFLVSVSGASLLMQQKHPDIPIKLQILL